MFRTDHKTVPFINLRIVKRERRGVGCYFLRSVGHPWPIPRPSMALVTPKIAPNTSYLKLESCVGSPLLFLLSIIVLHFTLMIFPLIANAEEKIEMPPLHHVVKVAPPEGMKIPKTFPLNDDGQIDCKTCHGIKDIEKTPIDKVDKKAKDFHRGGPYKKLSDFCYNCHKKKGYQRPNIHKLLDDKGEYDEKDCEYCHKEAPDLEKEIKRDELEFRLPPQKLCFGCHLKTPHFNALNHLVKPDEKMRKRIRAYEKKHDIILPLDEEGKVMCVTCHSPHQAGVIDEKKPAGKQVNDVELDKGISYEDHAWNRVYQADKKSRLETLARESGGSHRLTYQRIKAEVLLRLPAKNGRLCMACHKFER